MGRQVEGDRGFDLEDVAVELEEDLLGGDEVDPGDGEQLDVVAAVVTTVERVVEGW